MEHPEVQDFIDLDDSQRIQIIFGSFAGNQIEEAYSAYFGPDGYV